MFTVVRLEGTLALLSIMQDLIVVVAQDQVLQQRKGDAMQVAGRLAVQMCRKSSAILIALPVSG
jgi:hypothetical protein